MNQLSLFDSSAYGLVADGDTDTWATPRDVYEYIVNYWMARIEGLRAPKVDVFASASNTKCKHFITEEQDALKINWMEYARELGLDSFFWMNCPYSQPTMTYSIEQAIYVAQKSYSLLIDAPTFFLLPAWTDSALVSRPDQAVPA